MRPGSDCDERWFELRTRRWLALCVPLGLASWVWIVGNLLPSRIAGSRWVLGD